MAFTDEMFSTWYKVAAPLFWLPGQRKGISGSPSASRGLSSGMKPPPIAKLINKKYNEKLVLFGSFNEVQFFVS